MDYKTINLVVTDIDSDGPALAAASALAIRYRAHLDVQCIGIDPIRYDAMPMGGMMIVPDSVGIDVQKRADALLAWVKATIPAELDTVAMQAVVIQQMEFDREVARTARYADLVIASKAYGPQHSPVQVAVLESVLFNTGAPVLVVPDEKIDFSKPLGRLVVAWNETREALSAIRKALPLLIAASHVDIVVIDPAPHSPERSDPGGSVALMLTRHGVRAEVTILARSLPRVSDILARFATEHAVDAIVMGAYGHSRFREAILGGATRDMLETAKLPLIMAH